MHEAREGKAVVFDEQDSGGIITADSAVSALILCMTAV